MLKFILGSKAWGNKTKEMYYSLLSLRKISFVLWPKPRSQCSELVYLIPLGNSLKNTEQPLDFIFIKYA